MLPTKRKNKKSLHQQLIRHLREWHRKLGILTAVFIIFLAASGILINHANDLSLDTLPVKNTGLLNFYGIKKPEQVRFYANKKIVVTDNYVWLNNKLLIESDTPLVSAVKLDQFFLLVFSAQISLYSADGELIDQLDGASGVPSEMEAVAINKQHIIVKTANSNFQTDSDLLTWQNVSIDQFKKNIHWIQAEQASIDEIQAITWQYKSQFLTWEKVLLDAHSGRIFSRAGIFISDAIAIFLILLSLSGIYIWLRYAKNKR